MNKDAGAAPMVQQQSTASVQPLQSSQTQNDQQVPPDFVYVLPAPLKK